jgi:hypothetical protein
VKRRQSRTSYYNVLAVEFNWFIGRHSCDISLKFWLIEEVSNHSFMLNRRLNEAFLKFYLLRQCALAGDNIGSRADISMNSGR